MFSSTLLRIAAVFGSIVSVSQAGYTIADDYTPSNFFDKFDFFNAKDPTNGFVQYIDRPTAENTGLIARNDRSIYIGVDHKTVTSTGRASVRIGSKTSYTHGLFIADIGHMPGGICGTWPAFWTVGPNWPSGGEIDIIEEVHEATNNHATLHTNTWCEMDGGTSASTPLSNTCYAYTNGNTGCGVQDKSPQSYGVGFNQNGGGVYAMEWASHRIAIWFFPRHAIPGNALSENPDPATWGPPMADFKGNCNIDENFRDHQMIFDTTFCGDWAGSVWGSSSCASKANSCTDFVANNPWAFAEAYWVIYSLKVFKQY
ncbi:MAG: hypothetical protein M1817_000730 [Caeruleum heppii]|nr:MAG: hypothetical protein M1817_000730 [Caeruleum heppii]